MPGEPEDECAVVGSGQEVITAVAVEVGDREQRGAGGLAAALGEARSDEARAREGEAAVGVDPEQLGDPVAVEVTVAREGRVRERMGRRLSFVVGVTSSRWAPTAASWSSTPRTS